MTRTYADCLLLFPDGNYRRCGINATRFDSPPAAAGKLVNGSPAWVRPEELDEVLLEYGKQKRNKQGGEKGDPSSPPSPSSDPGAA